MSQVYTRTGDKGTTSLLGGSRIGKNDLRVSCYGTIDEANAAIGTAYSFFENPKIKEILHKIQKKLFVVGAQLASDEKGKKFLKEKVTAADVSELEELIDYYLEKIGKQTAFVIPGKSQASAMLHLARTIIRRGEREITTLSETEQVEAELLQYINRLSDLLFTLARYEEEYSLIEKVKNETIRRINNYNQEDDQSYKLTLDIAKKIAQAAETKANEIGVPIIISVVDEGGNLLLLHRMEDALLASIDISINKAYTSAFLKTATHEISKLTQPGEPLYGLQWTNNNRMVIFGGGYPLKVGDRVIGAIGVSGGTVEEDMTIASHALRTFEMERR
ncbi:MAG: cob(I)yrinic acid a,c-diamide adenosyltransferase [Clostridiales bacterium]|nr:cob(I)yrinic acid a,c-diamide adenosyltransferase [Clostridiales bacterium]